VRECPQEHREANNDLGTPVANIPSEQVVHKQIVEVNCNE